MPTMAIEINLDLTKLHAVALFAAKNGVRPYLNGVQVLATPTSTRLAATSGHSAGMHVKALPPDMENTDTASVILPNELLAKCKPVRGAVNFATIMIGDPHPSWHLRLWDGALLPFAPLEGKFPDLGRIIPREQSVTGMAPLGINIDLLEPFAKAAKMLGDKAELVAFSWCGADKATRVHLTDPGFIGVVMGRQNMDDMFTYTEWEPS
jgi:DNA polymerase III sliding clamp (beta) subunit (PCNA family)